MYANAKMIPVEAVPETRGGGLAERSGGGDFKYEIFETL
jgi:hypothetical protein